MKKQLGDLTRYVKTLESRLAAQEKGAAPRSAPRADTSGAVMGAVDPLAEAEQNLGYTSPTPSAGAPAAAPAAAAGAAARDDLEGLESQLGYSGGTRLGAGKFAGSSDKPVIPAQNYPAAQVQSGGSSTNARTIFNPQMSVIGDFVYRDTHLPASIVQPLNLGTNHVDGDANFNRFSFRELELALQSVVDPWTRLDAFVTFPGVTEEGAFDTSTTLNPQPVEIEEAYFTYNRLPAGLQLKGGKFRLEFGKENLAHTHVFFAVDRPSVITNFLSGDGLRSYGLSLQKTFPIGRDQRSVFELTAQGVTDVAENSLFSGINNHGALFLGRGRFYHEFDDSNNIDLGTSYLTGEWDQLDAKHQSLLGFDVTYRNEPVSGGVYHKTIARAEYLHGERDVSGFILDPATGLADPFAPRTQHPDGFYLMVNHQFQRDMYVGARYDYTDAALMMARTASPDGIAPGAFLNHSRIKGPSIWYEFETTEFNKFKVELQHHETDFLFADNRKSDNALFFEWTVACGPHGAHKY